MRTAAERKLEILIDESTSKEALQAIQELDSDKDGTVSLGELVAATQKMSNLQANNANLQSSVYMLSVMVLLSLVAVFGTSYLAIMATKDQFVTDGKLVSSSGDTLATSENIQRTNAGQDYRSLLGLQYNSLLQLKQLSIRTAHGMTDMRIAGFDRLEADAEAGVRDEITFYSHAGHMLHVTPDSVDFIVPVVAEGTIQSVRLSEGAEHGRRAEESVVIPRTPLLRMSPAEIDTHAKMGSFDGLAEATHYVLPLHVPGQSHADAQERHRQLAARQEGHGRRLFFAFPLPAPDVSDMIFFGMAPIPDQTVIGPANYESYMPF